MDHFVTLQQALRDHYSPTDYIWTSIDNWFDHKWLRFSGKMLGALGVWKGQLTVPPFNPERVLLEDVICGNDKFKSSSWSLHKHQCSKENLQYYIRDVSKDGLFVWMGYGDEEHISLLVYRILGEEEFGWYASLARKDTDRLRRHRGKKYIEFRIRYDIT